MLISTRVKMQPNVITPPHGLPDRYGACYDRDSTFRGIHFRIPQPKIRKKYVKYFGPVLVVHVVHGIFSSSMIAVSFLIY